MAGHPIGCKLDRLTAEVAKIVTWPLYKTDALDET